MRLMISITIVAGIAYAGFCLFLYANQYRILYQPRTERLEKEAWGAGDLKTVTVTTEDGLKLEGWYSLPADQTKPVIVVFHGNSQNIGTTFYHRMEPFLQKGYGILMVEYRGHADNKGRVREEGLYRDARAFLLWLQNERGVSGCDVVLYGESLGVGVAVQMALEQAPRALILVSSFPSFLKMAQDTYPYIPVTYLLKDQYRNDLKIKRIPSPMLFLHGEKDDIIPIRYGRILFDVANEPKEFVSYESGNHVNLLDIGVREKIMDFLEKTSASCTGLNRP